MNLRAPMLALACTLLFTAAPARAAKITALPTRDKVVALTFDACEAGKKASLDRGVLADLTAERVPYTIFMGGKFARDNAEDVAALARNPAVEIENHSWSHPRDMRLLTDARVRAEIVLADAEIAQVTGQHTHYFRFPGGNDDARTIAIAEHLGYKVIQWRWASGDPAPQISAKRLISVSVAQTRPGDILIFHINGRGVHTAQALPAIIDGLKARGFRFAKLSDYLSPPVASVKAEPIRPPASPSPPGQPAHHRA